MKINTIIRTVSRDDRSLHGKGPDGKQMFFGHPLRDYQALKDADGFVNMPLPSALRDELPSVTTAHPAFSMTGQVEHGIELKVAGPHMLRFSLDKWRDCDPDTTFLLVAFMITPNDDAPGVCASLGKR